VTTYAFVGVPHILISPPEYALAEHEFFPDVNRKPDVLICGFIGTDGKDYKDLAEEHDVRLVVGDHFGVVVCFPEPPSGETVRDLLCYVNNQAICDLVCGWVWTLTNTPWISGIGLLGILAREIFVSDGL